MMKTFVEMLWPPNGMMFVVYSNVKCCSSPNPHKLKMYAIMDSLINGMHLVWHLLNVNLLRGIYTENKVNRQ